jgi:hypothetical protein
LNQFPGPVQVELPDKERPFHISDFRIPFKSKGNSHINRKIEIIRD